MSLLKKRACPEEQREHSSMLRRKGFTLIELLVTIGIIILLAALIIVNVAQARQNGRDTKRISDLKSIQTALEMSFEQSKKYPIENNASGVPIWVNVSSINTTDLNNLKKYINPVPKDPMDGKSIDAVTGTGGDCNAKAPTSMSYRYKSDVDGSSYMIVVPLETRCEGLDKNDGGKRQSRYELWGGKDGQSL